MRGLFRYQTTSDRWWACVEDDNNGERVNIVRGRYEQMKLQPPFDDLPIENDGSKQSKRS
jgi:hypothetical protein